MRLATVHRVKGLEWPHVIILSATEGLMPHRLASDLEEERRVFHVALTRCSETVLIVADGPKSPFIDEMAWRSKIKPSDPTQRPARRGREMARESGLSETTKSEAEGSSPGGSSAVASAAIDEASEPEAAATYELLRAWRLEQASAAEVRAFRVLSNAVLRELARRRPTTDQALLAVPGIGPAKLASYGEDLKELLAEGSGS